MAKPQLENGHTQIANEILEKLARLYLSPNQWQIVMVVLRKTYGFHKKVDYIANSQIIEATGLCKAVVSRCLKMLQGANIITRNGKHIGFQKDWEKWSRLAKQSTSKVSSIANQSKLNSQPELAEQSTKVSSSRVTQKKKETIQKKLYKRKGEKEVISPEIIKMDFNEYIEELRPQYSDLNFDYELRKFHLYWSEGGRKLKRPKLALLNWMDKAREIKKEKGDQSGTGGRYSKATGIDQIKNSIRSQSSREV